MEFTSKEIVARIHIGEATLAKRVHEFATTAAGDLTYDEFDARVREIESAQLAMLEKSQPSEEESEPGQRCMHIGEPCCVLKVRTTHIYRRQVADTPQANFLPAAASKTATKGCFCHRSSLNEV